MKKRINALLILGFVICLIATIIGINKLIYFSKAVEAEGKVIEVVRIRATGSTSNSDTFAPKVKFTAADNVEYTFISKFNSYPAAYDAGDKVKVLYLKNAPSNSKIKAFLPLGGGALIIFIVGLGLCIYSQKK